MEKTILLVEDELFIRDLYERALTQAGYNVIAAEDGMAALEHAKEKPDLILLDIMLPKMNGIEVLKNLKNDNATKALAVILLTNLGQDSVIQEAFDNGASGYLVKVRLTPQQIVSQVKNFLDNPNIQTDWKKLNSI